MDLDIRIVVCVSQSLGSPCLGPSMEVQMVSTSSQSKWIVFANIIQGRPVLTTLENGSTVGIHLGVISGADGGTCDDRLMDKRASW